MRGPSKRLIAVLVAIPWCRLATQDGHRPSARTEVYAGSEIETYLRNLQVAGVISLYPWSARRFTAAEVDRLLPTDSTHPWAARYDWTPAPRGASLAVVRPEVAARVNTAFAFGYDDAAVWAGRGLTLTVQGGGSARYGPVAASFVPLASWAWNIAFPLATNGQAGRLQYADGRDPRVIDSPQRFGASPYALIDAGQTSVEASKWGVAGGMSSGNDYWGPASEFPVVLGNNAAGIPRIFVGSAEPVNLWIAHVQGRVFVGRPTQSEFSPAVGDTAIRVASGAVVVVTPRWPRGLEFGATHFIHRIWALRRPLLNELARPFRGSYKDPLENDLASVFFRWVVPRAGVEVYGEYGTEDYRYNFREVVLEPDHDAGYTIGLRKVTLRPEGRLRVIRAEFQSLQRGTLVQSRGQAPFYVHTQLRQGHTNRGQILGSAWGYGGAAGEVAMDWYDPRGRWTVAWSRLLRGDLGDAVATTPQTPRGLDVMHTLGVERLFFRGRYDITTGLTAVYELNRDFKRDAFNLNLIVGVRADLR